MTSPWTRHVCAQRSAAIDAEELRHRDDWEAHFDTLPLDEDLWDELERMELWSTLNDECDALIERDEEEWLGPEYLPEARRVVDRFVERARINNGTVVAMRALTFLRALAALIRMAERRGVPLLFAF